MVRLFLFYPGHRTETVLTISKMQPHVKVRLHFGVCILKITGLAISEILHSKSGNMVELFGISKNVARKTSMDMFNPTSATPKPCFLPLMREVSGK